MVEKCKVKGCDNPTGKNTKGFCKKHFLEFKEKEVKKQLEGEKINVLGMFISGIKTVFGLPFRIFKKEEKKEAVVPPASTPTVIKKEPKTEIKISPGKGKTPPKKSELEIKLEKMEKEIKTTPFSPEQLKEYKGLQEQKKIIEEMKEEEEEEIGKTPTGRIKSFFKEKGIKRESFTKKGIKEGVESKSTDYLLKGLGKGFEKIGKRWKTTKSHIVSALTFAILFPVTFWFTTAFTIPEAEGFLGRPIAPQWLNMALAWTSTYVILGLILFVLLPPSVILGQRGVDFSPMNGILLTALALGAGLWSTSNIFMPYWQTVDPASYELTMCLMKYGGNMQICALGEEEIQYEKEGTYETLKSKIGIVTPDRTIPPMRPNPNTVSSSDPYEFPFTLKNENEVGSFFDIRVPWINVMAASKVEGTDPVPHSGFYFYPPYYIRPGEYRIVQAEFDSLPDCERYMYFLINLTSEQHGGGSAKYGIVAREKDNENFMYFFDPEIITNPGPLDIYLYNLPFVLPVEQIDEREDNSFRIYIVISNKGEGIAEIVNITLIQTTELGTIISDINCDSPQHPSSHVSCPDNKQGNCREITLLDPIVETEGENKENRVMIRCNGYVPDGVTFIGKATDFISVVVDYYYTQAFEEQIACVKTYDIIVESEECNEACINQGFTEGKCCCRGGAIDPPYECPGLGPGEERKVIGKQYCPSDVVCDYTWPLPDDQRVCYCYGPLATTTTTVTENKYCCYFVAIAAWDCLTETECNNLAGELHTEKPCSTPSDC